MNKKYSISIDLDGTIFSMLSALRKVFPTIPENPKDFSLETYLFLAEQKVLNSIIEDPEFIKKVELYPGAEAFIKFSLKTFENVYIVTARRKRTEKETRKILKKLGIKDENIFFEPRKQSIIPDLSVIGHLEDDPKHLDSLKPYKTLRLFVPQRSWNFDWICNNVSESNIYPYKSFDEVTQMLNNIMQAGL